MLIDNKDPEYPEYSIESFQKLDNNTFHKINNVNEMASDGKPTVSIKIKLNSKVSKKSKTKLIINVMDKPLQNLKNEVNERAKNIKPIDFIDMTESEMDNCDCMNKDCPGCFFDCPSCGSPKCGHQCRVNRPWRYTSWENQAYRI